MAGFRGNGEGSIYQRTSDGRWLGVVTLGQDGTGRVVRRTVSAKTRAEVVRKLKKLQRDLDDGLPAPDTKMTVAQLLTHWHDDVLRPTSTNGKVTKPSAGHSISRAIHSLTFLS